MIYIDWGSRVIHVPKSYMTLDVATNVYHLDINQFRKDLKHLEETDEGIVYPTTHIHVPPFTVGGVTLARSVQIINNYHIEFEAGQYKIIVSGGNTNILDVMLLSGPSIASTNSAGLIESDGGNISSTDIENIAKKVWDEPTSSHTITGSFGEYIGKKLLSIKMWLTK